MLNLRRIVLAFSLAAAAATVAMAQEHPGRGSADHGRRQEQGPPGESGKSGGPGVLSLLPANAVTEHSIETKAGSLAYT
ncbi:MAG: hypothetical protein WBD53_05235, partial [Xanthobacteraceae bacterium]